ncbi:MAG: phosphatase PAP2 family protein, partial [Sciscionella sp.]
NTDTAWYLDVNGFVRQTPWLHGFLAAYALWGGLLVLALVLIGGWWRARRRDDAPRAVATAVLTGVAAVVAVVVNQQLISPAIARPRPCLALHHVEVLLACSKDYSMPSDHCIIAGAFVAGLFILHRKSGAVALVLALLLAFGRVYAGVHYPSDTVAGLLAGALIGSVIVLALRRPTTALTVRLALGPLRPLITTRDDKRAPDAAAAIGV